MEKEEKYIKKVSDVVIGKEYKDKLDQKILNNKILWFISLFLCFIIGLLTMGYISLQDNNSVRANFPKVNYVEGEQIVGNNFANKIHFLSFGMYHIINLSSFNEKTIESKLNEIIKSMREEEYIIKKDELTKFKKTVLENNIKSNFRVPNIILDEKYADKMKDDRGWRIFKEKQPNNIGADVYTIVATGDIHKKYGVSYEDPVKKCKMVISYFRRGGYTYVENFGTDCF